MDNDSSELIFLSEAWVHIELIQGQIFWESHLGAYLVGSEVESLQLENDAVWSLVNTILFFCIDFCFAFFASVSIGIFKELGLEEISESLVQRPGLVDILVKISLPRKEKPSIHSCSTHACR